jgi:Family of unknown function (DUF5989)
MSLCRRPAEHINLHQQPSARLVDAERAQEIVEKIYRDSGYDRSRKERFIMNDKPSSSPFEAAACEDSHNVFVELWHFMRINKKWWLLPIIMMLLLFGAMIILSGTAVAPFIYTIF